MLAEALFQIYLTLTPQEQQRFCNMQNQLQTEVQQPQQTISTEMKLQQHLRAKIRMSKKRKSNQAQL